MRGSSLVRSTTSTTGQPRRSTRPAGGDHRAALGQGHRVGTGETSATGAPSRRPRSTTTSTADQVGARSSRYASSWASRTTAARSARQGRPGGGPGADHHAADRARPAPSPRAAGPPSSPDRRSRAASWPARGRGRAPAPGRRRAPPGGPAPARRRTASSAGASRTTEAMPSAAPSTPSTSATEPPPGDGGTAVGGPGAGRRLQAPRTTRGGDAVPQERRHRPGPAPRRPLGQGHQPGGGGPVATGARPAAAAGPPGVGSTWSSTTQPPTRRPWSSIRTRLPTRDVASERSGHGVVEAPVDGRHVGHAPGPPGRRRDRRPLSASGVRPGGSAQSPSACFRSSTREVSSQVNSLSDRPKCP